MKIFLTSMVLACAALSLGQSVATKATGPSSAKVGKPFTVKVMIKIPSGYHIYGHTEKAGIPTAIEVAGGKGVASKVNYPATSKFNSLDGPVNVYVNEVTIPVTVTLPKTSKGKQTLKLKVTTQACNDRTCLPPKTDTLSVAVDVH
ncbi:MAG: protein-disulfide reductase DsbD N-terminal domain-containing protein [Armatimonadetes bacterium]|nr:protein-disulfide reductase DsbD N-terminal domain-containing protein [Armatimonadota bacterium]